MIIWCYDVKYSITNSDHFYTIYDHFHWGNYIMHTMNTNFSNENIKKKTRRKSTQDRKTFLNWTKLWIKFFFMNRKPKILCDYINCCKGYLSVVVVLFFLCKMCMKLHWNLFNQCRYKTNSNIAAPKQWSEIYCLSGFQVWERNLNKMNLYSHQSLNAR